MNLHTYEGQARLSVFLALAGGACAVAAAVIVWDAFDPENLWVAYNPRGKRIIAILGSLLLALLLGTGGFFVGLRSAGHKRNTRSQLSWTGFFLSAAAITLALATAVFFFLTRLSVTPR